MIGVVRAAAAPAVAQAIGAAADPASHAPGAATDSASHALGAAADSASRALGAAADSASRSLGAAADSASRAVPVAAHVLSAAADSAAHLARLDRLHEYRAFVERWHEFYLMTGTAAVTLAGLLFVALSLHLEVLVQDRFKALLVVARSTLSTFVYLLVLSLMLLAPESTPRTTGVSLSIFSSIFLVLAVREMRGAFHHEHAEFSRRLLRRRLLFPVIGYALVAIIGWFVTQGAFGMLFLMLSIIPGLLANTVWSSWDLLVRVARTKERMKSEAAE